MAAERHDRCSSVSRPHQASNPHHFRRPACERNPAGDGFHLRVTAALLTTAKEAPTVVAAVGRFVDLEPAPRPRSSFIVVSSTRLAALVGPDLRALPCPFAHTPIGGLWTTHRCHQDDLAGVPLVGGPTALQSRSQLMLPPMIDQFVGASRAVPRSP